jgi:hypothetical protein
MISRRTAWAGRVARKEGRRDAYWVLVGKPERKRPLARLRLGWEVKIKMYLQEVGWRFMDWIDLAQVRDRWRTRVYSLMNLRVS